ncbi:uncharacterized protein BDZ83DRAFT_135990 [Colletotrichum acutatum]|uniref:Uncharacterized protein n=1 Tax=Glomerella acutata TaxID=27357 RepID=A0AAD8XCB5_GLOAC|nr:uncharacterized protein BDZ83DRAFT_135990 [Colletotrichum acutatum]KAK1709719.1 hypothetical protein BDZ83DRAFT_135990 [Colletotrichum acutatum]
MLGDSDGDGMAEPCHWEACISTALASLGPSLAGHPAAINHGQRTTVAVSRCTIYYSNDDDSHTRQFVSFTSLRLVCFLQFAHHADFCAPDLPLISAQGKAFPTYTRRRFLTPLRMVIGNAQPGAVMERSATYYGLLKLAAMTLDQVESVTLPFLRSYAYLHTCHPPTPRSGFRMWHYY